VKTSGRKPKKRGENGEVYVRKRVRTLKPSPENEQLYRSIEDDPDMDDLVESIKRNGLHAPPIITSDNYIIAGHRRHAALKRIGQVWVLCRVLPERRDSMTRDEYLALLRDHNRQRHKSVAEQVREELVEVNPEEAYRHLRERRDRSVHAAEYHGVQVLEIEGTKTRYNISDQNADHVKYIKPVVFEDRRGYWPLSVRGVHYALLFALTALGLFVIRRRDGSARGPASRAVPGHPMTTLLFAAVNVALVLDLFYREPANSAAVAAIALAGLPAYCVWARRTRRVGAGPATTVADGGVQGPPHSQPRL
jgi:hypothetical protein